MPSQDQNEAKEKMAPKQTMTGALHWNILVFTMGIRLDQISIYVWQAEELPKKVGVCLVWGITMYVASDGWPNQLGNWSLIDFTSLLRPVCSLTQCNEACPLFRIASFSNWQPPLCVTNFRTGLRCCFESVSLYYGLIKPSYSREQQLILNWMNYNRKERREQNWHAIFSSQFLLQILCHRFKVSRKWTVVYSYYLWQELDKNYREVQRNRRR